MPIMEEKGSSSLIVPLAITFVPLGIGTLIALAIHKFGNTEKYDEKITAVKAAETLWVYAALVVFGRMVTFINVYPMIFKGKIMAGDSGNIRSNPFIFKQIGDKAMENMVIFEDQGDIGAYNRANRSIHHMIENFGAFVAGLFMAGSVFPFPVFVLVCLFSAGRVMHQVGYTSGYGSHAAGFMCATLAATTVEGLCFTVFLQCL